MENLYEIKKRMKSISDIGQMTRAMQLVSAAKMRRSKVTLESATPFFTLCVESMQEILQNSTDIDNPFLSLHEKPKGSTWKIAYFVLSGDQGLAGSYNSNVVRHVEEHIQQKILDNVKKDDKTTYTLYVFGKMAKEKLIKDGYVVDENFSYQLSEPTFYTARNVASIIREKFISKDYDLVYIIYTHMESAIKMEPRVVRLCPVDKKTISSLLYEDVNDAGFAMNPGEVMEYNPNANLVFSFLINTYLNAIVYEAMVEAYSSEQTARMTAMDNASVNADEMLVKLEQISNRARQSKITNELTEIINGAEQANNI